MRDVTINYDAVDNCSPVTNMLSVTSNEPVNGNGDGNTSPDWIIIDDHHLQLRAERAGNGTGRIYTITITSTDDCGNVATANTIVTVPHSNSIVARGIDPVMEDYKEALDVKVFPNPSNSSFAITINTANTEDRIYLSVFDIYGRRIEDKVLNSGRNITIGEKYMTGVYIVRLVQGLEKREFKLIKTN
jgi:hypothetical protein